MSLIKFFSAYIYNPGLLKGWRLPPLIVRGEMLTWSRFS